MKYTTFSKVIFNTNLFHYILSFLPGKRYKDWTDGDLAVKRNHEYLILTKELKYTNKVSLYALYNVNIFKFIIDKGLKIDKDCLSSLSYLQSVNTDVVDILIKMRQPFSVYNVEIALERNNGLINCLVKDVHYSEKLFFTSASVMECFKSDNVDVLRCIEKRFKQYFILDNFEFAAKHNAVNVLKEFYPSYSHFYTPRMSFLAATLSCLETFQWLYSKELYVTNLNLVRYGMHLDDIGELVFKHCDLNNKEYFSLFMSCVEKDMIKSVKVLEDNKCVDVRFVDKISSIEMFDILKHYISYDKFKSLLKQTIHRKQIELFTILIEWDAYQFNHGIINLVCKNSDEAFLNVLIRQGVKITPSCMYIACKNDNIEIVRRLLELGIVYSKEQLSRIRMSNNIRRLVL